MSESAKRRCKKSLPKCAFKWFPFCTREELDDLYTKQGMSQLEIAEKCGVSQKVVWRAMINYDIPRRRQIKRNQYAENNDSWVGESASYSTAHARVRYMRGSAKLHGCSVCGDRRESTWYDWANLTGNYPDPDDYVAMCRKCHRAFDKKRKEVNTHA
jgi:transcriptional regulator with XRE-family HTH domain